MAAGVGVLGVHQHVTQVRQRRAGELAGDGRGQLGDHLVQGLEVVDRAQVVGEEQRGGAGLAEDVAELVSAIAGVERHHHDAQARRRILGDEPARPVGEPDAERIATSQTEGDEAGGEGVHAGQEVGEGDPLGTEHHRLAVAVAGSDGREQIVCGGRLERVRPVHGLM